MPSFWDEGNFISGNGGYIRSAQRAGYPSTANFTLNIQSWSVKTKNITVPVTSTKNVSSVDGSAHISHRTVGKTETITIELVYDWVLRPEALYEVIHGFQFFGYYTHPVNTANNLKGITCDECIVTDLEIISSQKGDDVVRMKIEAVCNAPIVSV